MGEWAARRLRAERIRAIGPDPRRPVRYLWLTLLATLGAAGALVLSAIDPAGAPRAQGIDPALRPFAATSPWNLPIGGRATYGGPDDPETRDIMASGGYVNAGAYSIPVIIASRADPVTTIDSPQGTVRIHLPARARAAAGSDSVVTVIDPSHRFVDEFWIATRGQDGRWYSRRHVRNSLSGPGMGQHGIRAAGFSAVGGLLRRWELREGAIRHALVMTIPAQRARHGHVWPAIHEDGYAYGGSIPLGALLAIPPGVDVNALGLSHDGVVLAQALQRYGAYVGDTTRDGGTFVLSAEPALEGTSALRHLRRDAETIIHQLRRVTLDRATTPRGRR